MPLPTWDQTVALMKTVMPWVTGGLAGALVGFVLNRRVARKRESRLVISKNIVQFSIAGNSALRDKLSVSYDGNHYQNLFLCECEIANPSARTVENVVAVYEFHPEAVQVGEPTIEVTPVPSPHILNRTDLPANMLRCVLHTVHRGARVRFRALVNGAGSFQVHVTAKDDPELLVVNGADADESPERLVVTLGSYFALFILAGAFPILGGAVQSAVVMLALPSLRRTVQAFRSLLRGDQKTRSQVYIENQVVSSSAIGVALADRPDTGRALPRSQSFDRKAEGEERDPA